MTPCSHDAALKAVEKMQPRTVSVVQLAPERPQLGGTIDGDCFDGGDDDDDNESEADDRPAEDGPEEGRSER